VRKRARKTAMKGWLHQSWLYVFVDWWLIFAARLVDALRKARHDPKATGNAPHRKRRVK
jgi:hypothetical protein